ncbi:class I SAM-dependent methyltransferase [Candidatus Poriferisocius sp.]|uniref:class I SAM-dependent methyltransferase n=1 Tax=Candidatus Poriferisocius sp. TaxID=3101276 RepID=UPI003B0196D5
MSKVHQLRGSLVEARRELRTRGVEVDSDSRFNLDSDDGFKFIPRPAGSGSNYVEPPTPAPSPIASFHVLDSWISRFDIDGESVGGQVDLSTDERITWLMDAIGGVKGNRILELGPLEGAHTKMLCEAGASSVIAIEGSRASWLHCLVVKEIFELSQARFLYGDFNHYVDQYQGPPFDAVLACAVLYHQLDPVSLISGLSRLTNTVLVWTSLADDGFPKPAMEVEVSGYRGRKMNYHEDRNLIQNYCGGVDQEAVWLYHDELLRCFADNGLSRIESKPIERPDWGGAPHILFAASR